MATSLQVLGEVELGKPTSCHRLARACSQPMQSRMAVATQALEPGWPGCSCMTLPGRGRAGLCGTGTLSHQLSDSHLLLSECPFEAKPFQ